MAYGSGGFTSYSDSKLREQLGGWAEAGFLVVKMKSRRDFYLRIYRGLVSVWSSRKQICNHTGFITLRSESASGGGSVMDRDLSIVLIWLAAVLSLLVLIQVAVLGALFLEPVINFFASF
jgi:hypothetical protein